MLKAAIQFIACGLAAQAIFFTGDQDFNEAQKIKNVMDFLQFFALQFD